MRELAVWAACGAMTITREVIAASPVKGQTCAMDTSPSSPTSAAFGPLLRAWRGQRKRSQLDLALDAGVSQRHLSFIESGRARPSRAMILQLTRALDMPLRERNRLLLAAGFAPHYAERPLAGADMTAVRQALELMLRHAEPYPAMVVDRQWNLVQANAATQRFLALRGDPEHIWHRVDPSGKRNTLRLSFHPDGMQPVLRNLEQVATLTLARLQREVAADPANAALRELYDELTALPGISPRWRGQPGDAVPPPVLPLDLALGDDTLRLFSMISTFGTALDVTTEELRVESFFPADEFTANFFARLAAPQSP